jgi:hypothetical protein
MSKVIMITLVLLLAQTIAHGQEDTATVTYVPSLGIYVLQYNMMGQTYVDTLVPATRIDPSVKCSVSKVGESYIFSYLVSLSPNSQQYLLSFMVSHPAPILSPTKPNIRWSQGEFAQYKIWDWANTRMNPSGLWNPTTDIAPGVSLGGFSFTSAGLPTIVSSYFEGNVLGLAFSAEPPQLLYDLLDSIRGFPNNRVIRRTLGPKDPPMPFAALSSLDTIKSYVKQSRTLGWITSQTTAAKYVGLIDSARSKLQSNQIALTRAKLDTILMNVHADSSAHLTSEACALLRFNTEYLLSKLLIEE